MPNDLHQTKSHRGRVRRALAETRRSAVGAVRAGLRRAGRRTLSEGAPMMAELTSRVGDVIDAASTRLLAADEAASQLAFFVESIASEVDRQSVVGLVLRRNLLLDGTILSMIGPMLGGGSQLTLDDNKLAAAADTLGLLLQELVCLRDGGDVPTDGDRIGWLSDNAPDLPTDALAPYLRLERPKTEVASFVLSSYSLFLQTFLLRSSLRMAAELGNSSLPDTTS